MSFPLFIISSSIHFHPHQWLFVVGQIFVPFLLAFFFLLLSFSRSLTTKSHWQATVLHLFFFFVAILFPHLLETIEMSRGTHPLFVTRDLSISNSWLDSMSSLTTRSIYFPSFFLLLERFKIRIINCKKGWMRIHLISMGWRARRP